jgi:multidrug efflux pump subunit AcrA (membrane-fusion protein)
VAAAAPEVQEVPAFSGIVTTRRSEMIPTPFTGKMLRVDVKPNQRIHKGDQLARLDENDLKTEISALTADEKSQRSASGEGGARAAQAMEEYKRMRRAGTRVFSEMAIRAKLAEAQSGGASGGAAAEAAKSIRIKREGLERQLSQASVVAPFDGVVMAVKAREGQVAQKGEAIARVYDPSDLLFSFTVPKEHRKLIAEGKRVQLTIEGVDRPIWATVERIAEEEAPTNIVVVDADIDDSKLAPGEIQITSTGRVTLADNKPSAARKAVR